MSTEPNVTIPPATAFADVMTLLAIAADPKAAQERIDAIMAAAAQLDEAREAATAAQATLAGETAQRRAELDKREGELDRYEARVSAREEGVKSAWEKIGTEFVDIRKLDAVMRRQVVTYNLGHFDERLQTLPDWDSLHESVFGRPDPHFSFEDSQIDVLGTVTEPATTVPTSTLSRTRATTRRSTRRGADL